MARLALFLLSLLTGSRSARRELAWQQAGGRYGSNPVIPRAEPDATGPDEGPVAGPAGPGAARARRPRL